MSSEVTQGLENLKEIKRGEDPTNEGEDDALRVAEKEVARLYDEHNLSRWLPRDKLWVGVARWKRKNGNCKYNKRLESRRFNNRVTGAEYCSGHHTILINAEIYEEGNKEDFIDTVRHELAHAILYAKHGESQKHNSNWKQFAKKLGADNSRTSNKRDLDYNYYYGCPECGWKNGRIRKSKKIKKAHTRICTTCKTTCVSWEVGDEMPDEPGVVNVD